MVKVIVGTFMVLTGLGGLFATVCGVYFLPMGGFGLIGIVLGALLLWMTVVIWREFFSSRPAEQAPQSQPDRNGKS